SPVSAANTSAGTSENSQSSGVRTISPKARGKDATPWNNPGRGTLACASAIPGRSATPASVLRSARPVVSFLTLGYRVDSGGRRVRRARERGAVEPGAMRPARSEVSFSVLVCALATLFAFGCQLVTGDFKIEPPADTGSGTAQCKTGDYRCNGEYLLACGAGD